MCSVARITHLFIIQSCRQCENAGLGIQREDVVGPIGNHCVCEHRIGAEVAIRRGNESYLISAWRVLGNVERVSGLAKRGRIVVGISDLERKTVQKKFRINKILIGDNEKYDSTEQFDPEKEPKKS